jgi:hypothetical protein
MKGLNFLNATIFFELIVLYLFFLVVFSPSTGGVHKDMATTAVISGGFLSCTFLMFCGAEFGTVRDFLQAHKVFFYICILSIFANYYKGRGGESYLKDLFYLLLGAFFVKYVVSRFIFGVSRPGLFTENNFELPLLFIIFSATFYHIKAKHRFPVFMLIFIIAVVSGSRSALAAVCAVYAFLFIDKVNAKVILNVLVLIGAVFAFTLVFMSRSIDGFDAIDRVHFLSVFIQEIADWSLLNYMFGTMPITPLSVSGCDALGFYESLFSNHETSLCFSVVFHSLIIRGIFDYGVVGLIFVFYSYFKILKFSGVDNRRNYLFLTLALLNSLSVSSLNSVYFTLGCIVLISTAKWKGE